MYRRPRKKTYAGWLAALLALVVLGGVGWGLYSVFTGAPSLDRDAVVLPTPEKEGIFPWKDGVLCVYSNKLICSDMKGDSPWGKAIDLPENNMKACREGDNTIAWGSNTMMIIEKDGRIKPYITSTSGEIVMAVPGVTTFAAVVKEENQHRLRIYSMKDGTEIDEALFPYASVMGMGYFGEKSSQLWVLTIDSHGTEPVTRLTTYLPGKQSTGDITLQNEIGYAAVLRDKMTYIVGTHTLSYWEHASESKKKTPIYGWNLQDTLTESNGRVSFLFSPAGGNGNEQISSLWFVNTDGVEYRIPLSAGCIRAMLKENGRICVITKKGVYSMAQNGSGSAFTPFGATAELIPAVIPGKAFVIHVSHRNYLVKMP